MESWRAEWARVVGQETADSDLRVLKGWKAGCDESMRDDFLEVFKYAVKFSAMEYGDTWQAFQAARGQKLLRPFGVFRGVVVPQDLLEDGLEGEPFFEWVARFDKGVYRVRQEF